MTTSAIPGAARADLDPERPRRVGSGPVLFSTCTDLVPARHHDPPWCWDVEGYYRELGVHWRAGKTELRRAYLVLDGPSSSRLTYVLAQLLDPETRRLYDRTLPGERFEDTYLAEQRQAQEQADYSGFMFAGWVLRTQYGQVGLTDAGLASVVGEQMGWGPDDVRLHGRQAVDSKEACEHHDGAPPPHEYPYGYYRWRSDSADEGLLAEWQRLLVAAASERGIHARLAVGIKGETPHPWVHARVGRVDVLFVDEHHQPDQHDAARAVALVAVITPSAAPMAQQTTAMSSEEQR